MPLHDWTRVEAGTFHGFHLRWSAAICAQLNDGLLPAGYYADPEQVVRPWESDVIALAVPPTLFSPPPASGGVALVKVAPRTGRQLRMRRVPSPALRERRIVIRHVSDHRVVALIENVFGVLACD
jgi:hypothetical protein